MIHKNVKQHIDDCEKRRKSSTTNKKTPENVSLQIYWVNFRCQTKVTDICIYILVVSDYFTKWAKSFPMENMEAANVALIILGEVITRYGTPSVIHSDQNV